LFILPDQAARVLTPGEVAQYNVVRVADDVLIDLMKSGCDVTYAEAIEDALMIDVEGVSIPFASPQTLWRMKQTVREKDIPDRLFLRDLLRAQGIQFEESARTGGGNALAESWCRLKRWWKNTGD
jgi:hypothetical protein